MTDTKAAEFQRFNVTFRIQHVILLTTFLLLAFTGWALKYPEPALQHTGWWIRLWGGAKTAGIIHRVAGIIMLMDFAWHVIYMVYMLLTGKMKFDPVTTIVPLPSDLKNAVQNILYFLGLTDQKPKFGRYNYIQKFDYWAVFWGMAIIGLSGFVLTFPTQAALFIPQWSVNWIWEIFFTLHSDEALLAITYILIMHFYAEHLKWENFPMSMTWITGRLSMHHFKSEHPLEYELEKKENPGAFDKKPGKA
jgi:cytochrome b subunit of formate dehydrogenase